MINHRVKLSEGRARNMSVSVLLGISFIKHAASSRCSVEPIPGQCPFTGRYGISGTYMIYHYIHTYSIWHILFRIIWVHARMSFPHPCLRDPHSGRRFKRNSRHHSHRFTCHWLVIYGYGSKLGTPKLWMVNTKLDISICGPLNGLPFWPTSIWFSQVASLLSRCLKFLNVGICVDPADDLPQKWQIWQVN